MLKHFDTGAVEDSLRQTERRQGIELQWLEESCRDPGHFWTLVKGAFDQRFSRHSHSVLLSKYDFYYDSIIRNSNNSGPALIWYELVSGLRSLSYKELGILASAQASKWTHLGLVPGKTICIIRPIGVDLAVEMLAGLKTGCRISLLSPQGRGLVARRLEALKPDHITIDDRHISLVPQWSGLILPNDNGDGKRYHERESSYTYPSGQVAFRCFGSYGGGSSLPIDIPCDTGYLCALRDGFIALGIGPGQIYAAPGFHYEEVYPFLLLAGLLCGATYLHLLPKDIAAHPELVVQYPMKAFGVSAEVRDILLERPMEVGDAWDSWFRNPAESQDLDLWQDLVRVLRLEKSYAFNMRWNAGLGGGTLFSIRRKGMTHTTVLPVPGNAWCLADLSSGRDVSPTDIGLYAQAEPGGLEGQKRVTADIIARNGRELLFRGVHGLHRKGRIFPVEDILMSLRELGSRYRFFYSIVAIPMSGSSNGQRIVFLVFRGATGNSAESRLLAEIRSTINREAGDEFQPDSIEFFSLYPRFQSVGEVDHGWCRQQYLTGALQRKSRSEIVECITRLRGSLLEMEDAQWNMGRSQCAS
jgi:hypothetical protein